MKLYLTYIVLMHRMEYCSKIHLYLLPTLFNHPKNSFSDHTMELEK